MTKKVLIMYVPNFHAGYGKLINDVHPDKVVLLDTSVLEHLVLEDKKERGYLERSFLHAWTAYEMQRMIRFFKADYPFTVDVIGASTKGYLLEQLSDLYRDGYQFVLPEEDISTYLVNDYLRHLEIPWEINSKIMLRWNKENAEVEKVPKARKVTDEELGMLHIMASVRAREVAERSDDWWRQVGAVVFDEESKEIHLFGFNKHLPNGHHRYMIGDARSSFGRGHKPELVTAIHAEQMIFVKAIAKRLNLSGLSMYVSTYPCPYCANQIALSGIKKLYFTDGYSVMDQGRKLFETFGIETVWIPKEVMEKAAT